MFKLYIFDYTYSKTHEAKLPPLATMNSIAVQRFILGNRHRPGHRPDESSDKMAPGAPARSLRGKRYPVSDPLLSNPPTTAYTTLT